MSNHMEIARNRLFSAEGFAAADIKLYPGANLDATADQMAAQVNNAIAQIESGDYELIESFDDD